MTGKNGRFLDEPVSYDGDANKTDDTGQKQNFLDERFTVDPRKEKQTMAFALINFDT